MSTSKLIDEAISEIERPEAENELFAEGLSAALAIINAIVSPFDCDIDDDGHCGTHTALQVDGRCGQTVARAWLAQQQPWRCERPDINS